MAAAVGWAAAGRGTDPPGQGADPLREWLDVVVIPLENITVRSMHCVATKALIDTYAGLLALQYVGGFPPRFPPPKPVACCCYPPYDE